MQLGRATFGYCSLFQRLWCCSNLGVLWRVTFWHQGKIYRVFYEGRLHLLYLRWTTVVLYDIFDWWWDNDNFKISNCCLKHKSIFMESRDWRDVLKGSNLRKNTNSKWNSFTYIHNPYVFNALIATRKSIWYRKWRNKGKDKSMLGIVKVCSWSIKRNIWLQLWSSYFNRRF